MDSTITWAVPHTQLSTDRQRALWFVDVHSKVNGQDSCWKATSLIEEDKKRSAWYVELHAVFQAVMEELTHVKSPYVFVLFSFKKTNIYIYLFIWLCQVLVVACEI